MKPVFFDGPAAFGRWLEQHHGGETELWVGFHKKATGKPSMTWNESVDQALRFGWIDGVRKSLDGDRYVIRFTPRKPTSIWSAKNIRRMEELIAEGVVAQAGLDAYARRTENRSRRYAFEQDEVRLPPAYEQELRANREAWTFFQAQAKHYRKVATWWVVSAKREETQRRRLAVLIRDSAAGERIGPMRRT